MVPPTCAARFECVGGATPTAASTLGGVARPGLLRAAPSSAFMTGRMAPDWPVEPAPQPTLNSRPATRRPRTTARSRRRDARRRCHSMTRAVGAAHGFALWAGNRPAQQRRPLTTHRPGLPDGIRFLRTFAFRRAARRTPRTGRTRARLSRPSLAPHPPRLASPASRGRAPLHWRRPPARPGQHRITTCSTDT